MGNRPVVHAQLIDPFSGHMVPRIVLADTGAGSHVAPFELLLRARDCQQYMGLHSSQTVALGGAIVGTYPIYALWMAIPALTWGRRVRVVAIPDTACPVGLDGFACFRFLNTFTYGNFGQQQQFGLETSP